jgi:hypothetical protein
LLKMENGKRTVLVAASAKYADKLAKRTSKLFLERGKGKAKASEDDLNAETKVQDSKGMHGGPDRRGSSRERHASTRSPSLRVKRASTEPQYQRPTEEYTNPFTGLPIVQETGFEPGPSNRPPPPGKQLSRTASAPNPKILQNLTKVSVVSTVIKAESQKDGKDPPPAYHTLSQGASSVLTTEASNLKGKEKESSSGTTTNSAFTDDEAFARSLQQEEFRDLQRERDMLLTHALANGTADDGDVELAEFMLRETEDLIASTGGTAGDVQVPEGSSRADLSPWDVETQQMQLDLLYALELEHALRTEDSAHDASVSEAMRLQAEFDAEFSQEKQNDEAWEAWKKMNIVECVVCGDEHHTEELLRPCEHGYCEGCLQEGFKNALISKTPLKCCKKALSVDECSGLEANFIVKYKALVLELTTQNPMYCCNKSCSKFLPPQAIVGETGTCAACGTQTCRHCRKLLHPGVFCEEDQETKAVKELAMQKGWKSCPGCNHLIERESGCLYMICSRCQTAFCYRCSKRWNECESTCPDGEFLIYPSLEFAISNTSNTALSATHPKY